MLIGISEAIAPVMSLLYGPMFSELPTLKESTRREHSMDRVLVSICAQFVYLSRRPLQVPRGFTS